MDSLWPLISQITKPVIEAENFSPPSVTEFFNTIGHELSFATLLSNGSYRRHQETAGEKIIQVQCPANALDQSDCTDIFVDI